MKKVFLFDCDQTIWVSEDHDYVSSMVSPLTLVSENSIIRVVDGKIFSLKSEIRELFRHISNSGDAIGIVSDNRKSMAIKTLKLFGLYKYIDPAAINIKLWKGYCPKQEMVVAILKKPEFTYIPIENVYWFDDKDYSKQAASIGVKFTKVVGSTNLVEIVKELIA